MEPNPAPDVDSKFILTSRTIIGAIVMLLPTVFGWFGIHLDSKSAQELGETLISLVGAGLVVWGRLKATKPITFRATPPAIPPELPAAAIFLGFFAAIIALYLAA